MNKKCLRMGVIGMFSLILVGICLTLGIAYGGAGYWFALAGASVVFLCDTRFEERKDDNVGRLHLFYNGEGYSAVGFEFKKPVDQIASMSEVKMCVHVSSEADE